MKICPHCQTTYTDDSLQFCLQDGAPLAPANSQDFNSAETLVSPKTSGRMQFDFGQTPAANWENSQETKISAAPRKSGTGLTVVLTVFITLLIFGGAFAGFLIYRRSQKIETTAQNNNSNVKTINAAVTNSGNTNQKTDTNVHISPSPSASPTARPTLNPNEAAAESGIKDVIENWKEATENHDLDAHLASYADTVDYYKAGKVSSAKIRSDRERAFSDYDNLQVNISNLKVTPDESGDKATVTFDKEWNFQNDVKSNTGKVRQQLTFGKINGKWLITSEKDLKVYYAEKSH